MVATGGETESEKISKNVLMQHIAEKNVGPSMEVSLLGVGTVLRLDRDA